MSDGRLILAWVVCVIVGGLAGFLLGYAIWQLGFELIGGSVALVGAGLGGVLAFLGFMSWRDRRESSKRKI